MHRNLEFCNPVSSGAPHVAGTIAADNIHVARRHVPCRPVLVCVPHPMPWTLGPTRPPPPPPVPPDHMHRARRTRAAPVPPTPAIRGGHLAVRRGDQIGCCPPRRRCGQKPSQCMRGRPPHPHLVRCHRRSHAPPCRRSLATAIRRPVPVGGRCRRCGRARIRRATRRRRRCLLGGAPIRALRRRTRRPPSPPSHPTTPFSIYLRLPLSLFFRFILIVDISP